MFCLPTKFCIFIVYTKTQNSLLAYAKEHMQFVFVNYL